MQSQSALCIATDRIEKTLNKNPLSARNRFSISIVVCVCVCARMFWFVFLFVLISEKISANFVCARVF